MQTAQSLNAFRDETRRADRSGSGAAFERLRDHLEAHILGQSDLVESLLISLLADGHLLVEGAPGLAKTTAIKTLAAAIEGEDHRIQFTPDLLPADLTGTEVFQPETGSFRFERGPIFHNLILADEINRAPLRIRAVTLPVNRFRSGSGIWALMD